ncbi:MAG: hypothetical protein ACF8Q5_10895 [Phycisphaerales bacterium JB040]
MTHAGPRSRLPLLAFVGAVCACLAGCSTVSDAQAERGTGETALYRAPFATVWHAAVTVVEQSELELLSADEATGEILAHKGLSPLSAGENVAIYVEPVTTRDEPPTSVEVVSVRAMAHHVLATDWGPVLQKALRERLIARGIMPAAASSPRE